MRIAALILLPFIYCTHAQSQDVDIDKYYFKTNEIEFPKKTLPLEKRTYKYNSATTDGIDFNENNAIQLNGFKKDENGVVEVSSMYGGGLHWAEQKTNTRTDPNTKANFYSISIVAICDGRIKLECKEIDYKWYTLEQFRRTYGTKEFGTELEAKNEFNSLLKSWTDDSKLNFKKFVAFNTNYRANNIFGFAAKNINTHLWLLGSKDHPEYQNHQKYLAIIKNIFTEVKHTGIPANIQEKLLPVKNYFDSIPKLYAEDSKKHKKMRYSAYYNLMKIYYSVEDFTKAETYANLLIANDYDTKDGKKMLEAIKERKELWVEKNVTSSHFALAGETEFTYYITD
jgi:hypothetical protein